MDRIVFLNGSFIPYDEARIPIMDRGFLFADAIYEVSAVLDGELVDNEAHLSRLDRSLTEIGIASPYSHAEWVVRQVELVRRNRLVEGIVYIQVTRGVAERDFGFADAMSPTVVMFTQVKTILESRLAVAGAAVITVPDLRWARRDIKSVGLLAQVLAKRQAAEAGAAEAFMVEDGFVTEGGSSTAFIITQDGVIVTRPLSSDILPGITRLAVLRLAAEAGLRVEERAFTVQEALRAAEVFYTSASTFVAPVVSLDGQPIGSGRPGPHARKLRTLYIELARASGRDVSAACS
ncbi:D-amino-acid transaminase [Lichenifustis flavocetrariae]|uniref:Probable branched-chain-amino-acid aminotransferase n=1 Tax=Lichenifustis flavocetrariae TaxID=2949735 RepID=A0AA41YYE1_9HYPH|nr:D-amino-acid transaminase [Lichenifustis flavocetrariae]MCW6507120.1 D-amino-acid transaminase [Lichenifustis flavocetrariae]